MPRKKKAPSPAEVVIEVFSKLEEYRTATNSPLVGWRVTVGPYGAETGARIELILRTGEKMKVEGSDVSQACAIIHPALLSFAGRWNQVMMGKA